LGLDQLNVLVDRSAQKISLPASAGTGPSMGARLLGKHLNTVSLIERIKELTGLDGNATTT
jgi:hypothetical protein